MYIAKGFNDGLKGTSTRRGGIEMEPDLAEVKDVDTLNDAELAESTCSICNQAMFGTDPCWHWPGQTYLVNGEKVLCYPLFHQQRIIRTEDL